MVAEIPPNDGHWVIFEYCVPYDVTRAYDKAGDYPDPRIWAAERDRDIWKILAS